MGIILINTVIGIIQEIRAKKTIDKAGNPDSEVNPVVIAGGEEMDRFLPENLVLDDLVCLKTGDQVPADAKVLEGSCRGQRVSTRPVSRTICPKAREMNFFQEAL